jgi:hypothetical protein
MLMVWDVSSLRAVSGASCIITSGSPMWDVPTSPPRRWGCGLGEERRSLCVCLWNESAVGCGRWLGLRIGGIYALSSVAGPLCQEPEQWLLWWEAERLPRSGWPVARRRPGCPRLGQPVRSGCGAAVCWSMCSSGNRPARPVPGSSGGVGTGTACGPPSLRASGAGGRVDHGMTIGGALAQPSGWCRAHSPEEIL